MDRQAVTGLRPQQEGMGLNRRQAAMDQHPQQEDTELLRPRVGMVRLQREAATGPDPQQADMELRSPVDTANEARTYRRKEWVKK